MKLVYTLLLLLLASPTLMAQSLMRMHSLPGQIVNVVEGCTDANGIHSVLVLAEDDYSFAQSMRILRLDQNLDVDQVFEIDNIGVADVTISGIVHDTDGGYLMAGHTVVDFNTSDAKGLLLKTDASGNVVWSYEVTTTRHELMQQLRPHPNGGYIACGYGYNQDLATPNYGIVMRLDNSGQVDWAHRYEHLSFISLSEMEILSNGSIVVVGESNNGSINFKDVIAMQLDANGNVEWKQVLSNGGKHNHFALSTLNDGNVIIAIGLESALDLRDQTGLVKINTQGQIVWQTLIETTNSPIGFVHDVVELSSGQIAVAGQGTFAPITRPSTLLICDAQGQATAAYHHFPTSYSRLSALFPQGSELVFVGDTYYTGNSEMFVVRGHPDYPPFCHKTDDTFSTSAGNLTSATAITQSTGLSLSAITVTTSSPGGTNSTLPCGDVGLTEQIARLELKVAPNPAQDFFRLSTDEVITGTLEVMDITGKTVLNVAAYATGNEIDVSSLAHGVYHVRLLSEAGIYRGEVVLK